MALIEILKKENPRSIRIATLFFKSAMYKKEHKMDYVGIEIPDRFIVGYGLDYNGLGRNLGSVYGEVDRSV